MTGNGDLAGDEPQAPVAAGDPQPAEPAPAQAVIVVHAHTYIRNWGSAADPVAFKCDDGSVDGSVYVVKARHNTRPDISRMMIADHVVGRAGHLLLAAVPDIAFVDVPAALIALQPQTQDFIAG